MTELDKKNIEFYSYAVKALIDRNASMYKDSLNGDTKDAKQFAIMTTAADYLMKQMVGTALDTVLINKEHKFLYDYIIAEIDNTIYMTAKNECREPNVDAMYKVSKELLTQVAKEGGFIE